MCLLENFIKQKLESTPDLEGWVRSDQVQNLTQGSGGQSKGKGRVCCRGTLADWVKIWTVYYRYGDTEIEIFLTPHLWPDCSVKRVRAPKGF